MKFNTKLLHGGFEPEKTTGSTLTPIYQVSAFAQESAEQLEKVFNNKAPGYAYTRISNPTVAAFENRMNTLEKGVGAVACSSGMAAAGRRHQHRRAVGRLHHLGVRLVHGSGLLPHRGDRHLLHL